MRGRGWGSRVDDDDDGGERGEPWAVVGKTGPCPLDRICSMTRLATWRWTAYQVTETSNRSTRQSRGDCRHFRTTRFAGGDAWRASLEIVPVIPVKRIFPVRMHGAEGEGGTTVRIAIHLRRNEQWRYSSVTGIETSSVHLRRK